jgi:hypothetical protein
MPVVLLLLKGGGDLSLNQMAACIIWQNSDF